MLSFDMYLRYLYHTMQNLVCLMYLMIYMIHKSMTMYLYGNMPNHEHPSLQQFYHHTNSIVYNM